MINYVIASDLSQRWLVIDIRGGFECRIILETDTRGKATWVAGFLNKYGDDRGAPTSFVKNDGNSKSHSLPIPNPPPPTSQA